MTNHSKLNPFSAALFLLLGTLGSLNAMAQIGAPNQEWEAYSGDKGSTKYSALTQINESNVDQLEVAWTWDSPDNTHAAGNPSKAPNAYKSTPLVVDGVMYAGTTYSMVSAIDPTTGESLWTFDPKEWDGPRPGNLGFNKRGIAFWKDENGNGRVILGTNQAYVYAIDAKTGKLIEEFGEGGKLDLLDTLRRRNNRRNIFSISPAIIANDVIVIGAGLNDRPILKEMTPGDVRGFDVRTGKLLWTFHNPPEKGEVGYDTWKDGSADYTGNSNVWTHMSADEELGLVYLPFGTPTNDFYGGHRKGDGLFAESLVCVESRTGKLVWYFQHVHHGIWDWDLPTAPALIDITVDGKPIKALAQSTKQGFLWVLDRTNGKAVWPIEERPVPQSTVPGEETSPTQPFPTKPAPFTPMGTTEDMLIDFTPELRAEALKILKQYNYGPVYTPPTVLDENETMTLVHPGWGGGGNWHGISVDPDSKMAYIPSTNNSISTYALVKPDPSRSNFDYIAKLGRGPQGPEGLPLFKPPYSHITAIDLNTGDHAWVIPLGDGPIDHPAIKDLNLPPMGGRSRGMPVLTKSLLFIVNGGTNSPNFRAFNKTTGETIWETTLPDSPAGTPMTYMAKGKQYIIVPSGGGRSGAPARLVALALP